MASSPIMDPSPPVSGAEPKFHSLNARVSVSHPDLTHRIAPSISSTSSTATPPPQIIVLFSWMAAPRRAVSKYLSRYRTTYPSTTIYHIITTLQDATAGPILPWSKAALAPVVDALAASPSAPILLHLFSNSGAYTAHQLLTTFRAQTGRPLPCVMLVLDSAPGHATFTAALRASIIGLKGLPVLAREIAVLLLALVLGVHRMGQVLGLGDTVARAAEGLNDGMLVSACSRLYLYSKADELVSWEDVEEHAREIQAMGGCVVQRVRFEESKHAAHAMRYGEEYWRAVDEGWEEAVGRWEKSAL